MPTGTTGATLVNGSGGTLTDPATGASLIDPGDTVLGHPIPRTVDTGAALTNAAGGTLLDPKTGAVLTSEGLGITTGRITKYLQAGFDVVPGQDFTVHAGDSAQLIIKIADIGGAVFDDAQATITWTAGKPGAAPVISKSSADGKQIRKPGKAHNIVIVYLGSEDTNLPPGSDLGAFYQHTLRITTVDLQTVTAMTGVMTVIRSLA